MIDHSIQGHPPRPISSWKLLKIGLYAGSQKGGQAFLWMMKIILPVSLFTTLLAWSGWLERIDFVIAPAMNLFGLPSIAALPLLMGMLTGIYGGIAAMVVLPFDQGEMTLIGIFLLMAHNLIQEGIIQGQSGIHPLKITAFRIVTASLTVMIASPWLIGPTAGSLTASMPALAVEQPALYIALSHWLNATWEICIKMFLIIMAIMILLEIAKIFDWIVPIVRIFSPLLKLMGLGEKVGLLWMTAIIFGLTYGGAVIVEEAKAGHLNRADLKMLHLSISINHSMVEDPLLFIALGLNAAWLYFPRLVMAIITVHAIQLWLRFSGKAAR